MKHIVFTPRELMTISKYANIQRHHSGMYMTLDIFFSKCPEVTHAIINLVHEARTNPQVIEYNNTGYNKYSPFPSHHDYIGDLPFIRRTPLTLFRRDLYCLTKAAIGIYHLLFNGNKKGPIPTLERLYLEAIAEQVQNTSIYRKEVI